MKAVMTVIGKDKLGIVSNVTTKVTKLNMNILDINQTLLEGFFTMVIMVKILDENADFTFLSDEFKKLGENIGVEIRIQHEDLFNAMHRL